MLQILSSWLAVPAVRAAVIIVATIIGAIIVERVLHRVLMLMADKTETDLDDRIIRLLRRPVFLTAIFVGVYLATSAMRADLSEPARRMTRAAIITLGVLLWAGAAMRIGSMILKALSRRKREGAVVQPSTLPLFDISFKVLLVVVGAYVVFLAWNIDLTAWLASAGIVGVAVGFGAKDSLANLFAGIFILVDAPYRVGDVVVLDDQLRGRVTTIGIRSTRILTMDGIEVTIPNGLIGNSRIVNEAGGPDPKQRLKVAVQSAYGSDIDRVREVLLACADDVKDVCLEPAPMVRFENFGDSGLDFVLLAWVTTPSARDQVLDVLNTRIYKAFADADLEIPFPQRDLNIKPTAAAIPAGGSTG